MSAQNKDLRGIEKALADMADKLNALSRIVGDMADSAGLPESERDALRRDRQDRILAAVRRAGSAKGLTRRELERVAGVSAGKASRDRLTGDLDDLVRRGVLVHRNVNSGKTKRNGVPVRSRWAYLMASEAQYGADPSVVQAVAEIVGRFGERGVTRAQIAERLNVTDERGWRQMDAALGELIDARRCDVFNVTPGAVDENGNPIAPHYAYFPTPPTMPMPDEMKTITDRTLEVIEAAAERGMTRTQIATALGFKFGGDWRELDEALDALTHSGWVVHVDTNEGETGANGRKMPTRMAYVRCR